jgi:hypothetical protein
MSPNPSPILLSRVEVQQLLAAGQVLVRRRIRQGPIALKPRERRVGDRCWVREPFCCRLDGDQVKIRYLADGAQGVPRFIPAEKIGPMFRPTTYVSHPAEYMPKILARLTVEVIGTIVETGEDGHQVELLSLDLKERPS